MEENQSGMVEKAAAKNCDDIVDHMDKIRITEVDTTQKALAILTGMNPKVMQRMLSRKHNPTLYTACKIAWLLGYKLVLIKK